MAINPGKHERNPEMMTRTQVDAVMAVMRTTAAEEIVPRFQRLSREDVSTKSGPEDLVTIADIESERRLSAALTELIPGSVVVGEEGCEADPGRLRALAGEAPVWLIDPVDGTNNFVKGKPCFAVIVAFCSGGRTRAGWILDPLSGALVWAGDGRGAWLWTPGEPPVRLTLRASGKPVSEMSGSLGWKLARRLRERGDGSIAGAPARIVRLGCTGREYMDLATGRLDFVQYTRLKPWDHAAGLLIHAEAGGWSRLVEDGGPYRPEPRIHPGTILAAPDEAGWQALKSRLDGVRTDPLLPL